ncbi:MAG: riboflavin synthase [Clostridium sp.]|nr:riboflavin synthase [Clostridium sp.]
MFTGIVEEIGTVKQVIRGTRSSHFVIAADKVLNDTNIGDSICTSGVCLTVTNMGKDYFEADVMAETMRRSKLGSLSQGSCVNLERALSLQTRLGGHIVSGHIDGTGIITRMEREENAVWVTVTAEPALLKYMIEKGSITIDGISLTIAYVDDTCFRVSIIPHTAGETTLLTQKVGDTVNLECDMIGKYVERLLHFEKTVEEQAPKNTITSAYLAEHGFL